MTQGKLWGSFHSSDLGRHERITADPTVPQGLLRICEATVKEETVSERSSDELLRLLRDVLGGCGSLSGWRLSVI